VPSALGTSSMPSATNPKHLRVERDELADRLCKLT
jgi:hypothetical protein